MITYYKSDLDDGNYEYTFSDDVFGITKVVSELEIYHDNPIMVLLEFEYDKNINSFWYGRNNSENYNKLKAYYIDDSMRFKQVYKECANKVIEKYQKEIVEQERLIRWWCEE